MPLLFTSCNDFSNCNYNNLNEVIIEKDFRNKGIEISVCKVDNKIIIDMISINSDKSRNDVFRYILQAAEELKEERYQGHTEILDVDNAKDYGQYDFLDACREMGIIKDL